MGKALDPLRLFHQVQLLQQSVLRCDGTALATTSQATATLLLTFRLETCAPALLLQAGGDPRGLQELLGYAAMAQVRQYLRWYDQLVHDRTENKAKRNLIER